MLKFKRVSWVLALAVMPSIGCTVISSPHHLAGGMGPPGALAFSGGMDGNCCSAESFRLDRQGCSRQCCEMKPLGRQSRFAGERCDCPSEGDEECSERPGLIACMAPWQRLKARLENVAVPVPGCYADWQAKRNLPEGPERAAFHPVPTRPMFQPRPTELDPWASSCVDASGTISGNCHYGRIPSGIQWHASSAASGEEIRRSTTLQKSESGHRTSEELPNPKKSQREDP